MKSLYTIFNIVRETKISPKRPSGTYAPSVVSGGNDLKKIAFSGTFSVNSKQMRTKMGQSKIHSNFLDKDMFSTILRQRNRAP